MIGRSLSAIVQTEFDCKLSEAYQLGTAHPDQLLDHFDERSQKVHLGRFRRTESILNFASDLLRIILEWTAT